MKNKINFFIICVLAAALALFFASLSPEQSFFSALLHRFTGDEDDEGLPIYDNMPLRPVLKEEKGLKGKSANPRLTDFERQVPFPIASWMQGLRQQMYNKVEEETRKVTRPELMFNDEVAKRKYSYGRTAGKTKGEKENDLADAPYLLWRELQLREDSSLLINMMLVNNRRQEQSHGVIVSQALPKGWNLSAVWPDAQVSNQESGQLKWLFAEASSQHSWSLQVVLMPDEGAEMPLLPEKSTTLRCCLPNGELLQYACLSLP